MQTSSVKENITIEKTTTELFVEPIKNTEFYVAKIIRTKTTTENGEVVDEETETFQTISDKNTLFKTNGELKDADKVRLSEIIRTENDNGTFGYFEAFLTPLDLNDLVAITQTEQENSINPNFWIVERFLEKLNEQYGYRNNVYDYYLENQDNLNLYFHEYRNKYYLGNYYNQDLEFAFSLCEYRNIHTLEADLNINNAKDILLQHPRTITSTTNGQNRPVALFTTDMEEVETLRNNSTVGYVRTFNLQEQLNL